ncbi:phage terminase large subunit [Pedobacter antarcticus]|uniref:phage terminase large subunit n=1 Tax=Pedobacter antarcticus TaxID=34086 RepID=UPI00292F9729|nr:phage terminase large subunit [Pedobacter antarcticus]
MLTKEEIGKIKTATLKSKSELLFQTRYLFKKSQNRKFVIGDHHKKICEVLECVLRCELVKVMINIAPRYGKTELAVKNFVAHALALNASASFIHLSYSDDLALDNSEAIRDMVESEAYQQMFPHVQIKQDSDAKKKWYTTEGGGVYARAAGGQVTGFGAGKVDEELSETEKEDEKVFLRELDGILSDLDIKSGFNGALIIDDPIKPDDADSDTVRERINNRFDSTIRNRVNSRNTPIIIIMQRLHENDLCGYLMANEEYTYDLEEAKADKNKWFVLSIPVIQTDAEGNEYALWPFKHTLEELKEMEEKRPIVFGRQYMMNPQPKEGYLYGLFKTYKKGFLPFSTTPKVRKAYIDTADTGTDYLCSIVYDELDIGNFVTDVIYSQASMETTEVDVAKQLAREQVDRALFESNNGGRGFARNVERGLRLLGNKKTKVEWFHQSLNKDVRIFTKSADVVNLTYFPEGWEKLWPAFAKSLKTYKAAGKNAHDDAEDALTGTTEDFGKKVIVTAQSKAQIGFY